MFIIEDIKLILDNARKVELFTPKQERELAKKIADSRADLWEHVLSDAAACPFIIEMVYPKLEEILKRGSIRRDIDPTPLINDFLNQAKLARTRSCSNKKIRESRKDAALLIAKIDTGLEGFSEVYEQLKSKRPFGMSSRPRNSLKFPKYLEGIEKRLDIHRRYKNRFWQSNIRLAISLTKKYDHGMIPFADMLHEGLIGLMTAVERFDVERGYRFSTYATWWVRHALNRFMANHGRTIRWPAHVVSDFEHLKRTREKILRRGDQVTPDLLIKESGMKPVRVHRILKLRTIQPISLEQDLPGLDGLTVADRLYDEKFSIDENLIDPAIDRIKEKVYNLPGIEGDILVKRFGLDGTSPKTLQEIAKDHDLSRERIRQLENRGLKRLRGMVRA